MGNFDSQISDEDAYRNRYSYLEEDSNELDNYDEDLYKEEVEENEKRG